MMKIRQSYFGGNFGLELVQKVAWGVIVPNNIASCIAVPSSHSRSKACFGGVCPDHLSEMSDLIEVVWDSWRHNHEIWGIII